MKHLSLVANATNPSVSDDEELEQIEGLEEESSSEDDSVFDLVAPALRHALLERGFKDLTVVQRAVLDQKTVNHDLQISSQTGSGKTVALGLVMAPQLLEMVEAAGKHGPRAMLGLVIVPTRELAVQVAGELEWLFGAVSGLSVECLTGGSSVGQERRRLERKPTLVVGTPGRLLDHIRTKALDCSSVQQLVLDEADRMLEMGFREELEGILEATPNERRTHLVSATFPAEMQKLARKYQSEPVTVQGTRLGVANEDIEHVGHLVRLHDRYAAIVNLVLLGGDDRTLIFVNTRAQAAELADQLAADGFGAAPISGELEQNQRTRTLEAFRSGVTNILVATDVAARGLDIPDVALVIHTDAPMDSESYTHRAGRTGRAGNKGRSVVLATPMRQRKVEYLLSRAKVKLEWREVPTAAAVEKALAKRERRRVREALLACAEPDAAQIKFAQGLLEDTDPTQLIARLVELCRDPRQRPACEIETLGSHTARGNDGPRGNWQDRPDPRGGRNDRNDRAPRTGGGQQGAERFELNWGHRGGATPQRILAVLCRRGDVSSRAIGTIDIDNDITSFEVSREVAREFERNATQPDERDPGLQIRRAEGRVAPRPQRRSRD